MMKGTKKNKQHPGGPSPEEAAAIVAAIERFMRATAPGPPPPANGLDPWLRAAILEGVEREAQGELRDPWIGL